MGREIIADWFVIQRWRTESKEFANTILLFPILTWKTGPYFFAHPWATFAWFVPSSYKLPKRGRPGTSGSPLIWGVSVPYSNLYKKNPKTATPAM